MILENDKLLQGFVNLGLTVISPFEITLPSGKLCVPILLKGFGAKQGMLIIYDFSVIKPFLSDLAELGKNPKMAYGFSTLTFLDDTLVQESILEMLKDWGWTGDPALKPNFLD